MHNEISMEMTVRKHKKNMNHISNNAKKMSLLQTFIFLWGLTVSMPALKIGGLGISNFFAIACIFLTIKNGKLVINKKILLPILLLGVFVITTIVNIGVVPNIYTKDAISMCVKTAFIILTTIILASNHKESCCDYFLKGLYYSAIIETFWIILQVILYYGFGLFLNQIVFGDLLHIEVENAMWIKMKDGLFRPTGISWDSASTGLNLVIAICIAKTRREKLLFSLGIILCTSRSALVCLLAYYVINVYQALKSKRIKTKNLLMGISVFLVLLLLFIYLFNSNETFNNQISRFMDAFHVFSGQGDSSSSVHLGYYTSLMQVAKKSSFLQLLFGYSTFSAGYPYSHYLGMYQWLNYAWTPESDFITLLVGNGLTGFIVYYYIILKNLVGTKNDKVLHNIVIIVLIGGFLYVYVRSMWTIELLIFIVGKTYYEKNGFKRRCS